MPEGWIVATAGNPPEYNHSVREFDMVTWDRLKRIDVEPEYDTWRAWAVDAGVHPAVTSYVDFVIPSLVLQPLVENAIKHGLLPKAEGGVIQVNTTRCNDEVLINITDNGVGFDTSKDINKASVGLSNVRFRVEKMMNGRMQIKSTPGAGTVVRLWLPLGKEEFPSI